MLLTPSTRVYVIFAISSITSNVWGEAFLPSPQRTDSNLSKTKDYPNQSQYNYPEGDPRRCQEQARATQLQMKRFEVLPGLGWDNLQNLEMGVVVSYNYSQCKVTDDGQYLIPDNVVALPVKSSYVETFAEMIDSYLKTTSTTSNSINVKGSLSLTNYAASGSFSREHQTIKTKQIEDNAVTTRVQLRYHRYNARLQPEPQLSPGFKRRLLSIAGHILTNNTALAVYEGELMVRDFGTHVLTSVVAGAGLEKVDFLKKTLVNSSQTDKTDILAEASASFFNVFKMGTTYKQSSRTDVQKRYQDSTTHSYISTHGGPLLGANTSLDAWKDEVDTNLVPMDRAGNPLYFLVTEKLLPELPPSTLAELEKVVRNSIETYYAMNTIRGCTKLGSPNFSFSANFDDGTCKTTATNLTFGGVYQTCEIEGRYLTEDPCKGMSQQNPQTGGFSCPAHYVKVPMYAGLRKNAIETRRVCHRSGFLHLSHKCNIERYQAAAYFQAFWCAANGHVPDQSGYLFGGYFTKRQENPMTGSYSCPELFYPLNILEDVKICLSDDFDRAHGLPFGGFFTCQTGNPLARPGAAHLVTAEGALNEIQPNSLAAFFDPRSGRNNGADKKNDYPKKCPEGYSQHTLTIEQGCAINYCIKSGALSGPNLPAVKRPPYSSIPPSAVEEKDTVVMFDSQSQIWLKDNKARTALDHGTAYFDARKDEDTGIGPGASAALGVGVTLAVVILLIIGAAVIARRRKRKQREDYCPLSGQSRGNVGQDAAINPSTYGSATSTPIPPQRDASQDPPAPPARVANERV